MSDIVWEDPGPDGRGKRRCRGHWDDVLDQLRAHPGRWARIATCDRQGSAASIAYKIRRGVMASAQPMGTFEATTRGSLSGNEFAVYARFVGEQDGAGR